MAMVAMASDPVQLATLANELVAAVLTRSDAQIFSATWVEDNKLQIVTNAMTLAREVMEMATAPMPAGSGAGPWEIRE